MGLFFFIFLSLYSFDVKTFENFSGKNLVCKGQYQILGYEFKSSNNLIRHALSKTDDDYYKSEGTYLISDSMIFLDIEGDLFTRKIVMETLELFIGVHSDNTLVCKCEEYGGDLSIYFDELKNKLTNHKILQD
tara:strand:- start:389 stop:787 length:399 start_codon:yes stop_codon:yes gene_type:complete